MEVNKSVDVMKKLRLTGVPYKIYKNTAFIKGVFNTAIECAKMEGTWIKTVSGIRGQIKKALKAPNGSFRATFEDRILSSDIVFVPVWYRVSIPEYYNQVFSMLLQHEQAWEGIKTIGLLRHKLRISVPIKGESFCKCIPRHNRKFTSLKIPHKLQSGLPFTSKLKSKICRRQISKAVLLSQQDKSVGKLLAALRKVQKNKLQRQKFN